jgi:hypothetical protein
MYCSIILWYMLYCSKIFSIFVSVILYRYKYDIWQSVLNFGCCPICGAVLMLGAALIMRFNVGVGSAGGV